MPYHVVTVRYRKPSDLRVIITERYITRRSNKTIRKQCERSGLKVLSVKSSSGYD